MRHQRWLLGLFGLYLFLWFWTAREVPVCFCWPLKIEATFLGVAGYTLFSLSLLLSSRWRGLEKAFGPLDQLYQLHRKLGIWAFCLILAHPWVEALKWLPQQTEKFFWFTLPIHGRLSVNLGSYAYWLMLVLLGVTFLKLLPYDKWKRLHKFMSLVFVLASLHIVLSEKRVGSEFSQALLYLPMALGLWAILYKQVYLSFFAKRVGLKVREVKYLTDQVVEVVLTPEQGALQFIPGQYGFFSFKGSALSEESHPFTLVETTDGSSFSILIKARGDYTKNFYQQIKAGCSANFEGPYGALFPSLRDPASKQGGEAQIWIAGGIGVVLFLAFIREFKKRGIEGGVIDFFYSVHSIKEAVYLEEFYDFAKAYPTFRVFLHCTESGTRLTFQEIKDRCRPLNGRQVFMCGPLRLTHYFAKEFEKAGVDQASIFYENFEFF